MWKEGGEAGKVETGQGGGRNGGREAMGGVDPGAPLAAAALLPLLELAPAKSHFPQQNTHHDIDERLEHQLELQLRLFRIMLGDMQVSLFTLYKQ